MDDWIWNCADIIFFVIEVREQILFFYFGPGRRLILSLIYLTKCDLILDVNGGLKINNEDSISLSFINMEN